MKKIKICFVTGSRADYGLLYWLMKKINSCSEFELQIIATGMHLSSKFGFTYKQIIRDGFNINRKVEMLLSSDTPSSISKSTGIGIIGFTDAYSELKPDIIIIVGDRFEIYSSAISALFLKIPIAHLSGGESTSGAFDEPIRHAITKIAWWHFVAAREYKDRVVQLGENPNRVFNVGGMGVDTIKKMDLLQKNELSKTLGFKFKKHNLLITYHPVTMENDSSESQIKSLLNALSKLKDTLLIFTLPNSDSNNRIISEMINNYVNENDDSISFTTMGHLNYLSAMKYVDGVVGNSSSGLAEAPTFKIGTINIGDRQNGRLKAKSVIDCLPEETSILNAIKKMYSNKFQDKLSSVVNPYGEGDASDKIYKILKTIDIPMELKKEFYDL